MEKSAIPKEYGFKSKKSSQYKGYPDFFKDEEDFAIVVEAKAVDHPSAISEVQHYMLYNKIAKDVIGIAVSGQTKATLKVDYFLKEEEKKECRRLEVDGSLLSLENIEKIYWKNIYGESVSAETLTNTLNQLNKTFNDENKVKDTDRSLFFSGLMIALKDNTFRSTYKNIQAPSQDEAKNKNETVLEAHLLNHAILEAITRQLKDKINNLSKQYSWHDRFSFIKNIDYSLLEYKKIIKSVEKNIFNPFRNDEKQDILGKAYKIFLKRAGRIDNKNIIITPDHIKNLMIELARLNVNDVVLDTCTGTGGFLMEAMEVMTNQAGCNEAIIERIKDRQLIGFETDSVLFALACSNMFLHGDGRTNLIFRSSLLSEKNDNIINNKDSDLLKYIQSLKPTKCIINPPYENNNSIRFTKQALDYIESNGKLIIIMPTPTLTRNQSGLTPEILKIAKLDFVIKMPYKLFSEQKRTVNTSIFGFTKTPHKPDDEVLFYNLEDDGLVSIQHKGRVDKYNKWDAIKESVLNAVKNSKEIADVCEKKKIYRDGVLNCAGVQAAHRESIQMVKIGDLFDIEEGSLASEDSEDGTFDFITGSEVWKKHSLHTHDTEALVYVVAAAGSLGRCHYVNGKFVASNLCIILTPKVRSVYPVNLRFYHTYLSRMRKTMAADLSDGTSKLTIDPDMFKEYYIDYVSIRKQNNFVKKWITPFEEVKKQLEKEIATAESNIISRMSKLF